MKKILLSILLFSALAFSPDVKILTAKGTQQQWQNIINIMEQSNAPHTQVVAAQKFLMDQLNPQLQTDTTHKK